jgi:hypothetical protein
MAPETLVTCASRVARRDDFRNQFGAERAKPSLERAVGGEALWILVERHFLSEEKYRIPA